MLTTGIIIIIIFVTISTHTRRLPGNNCERIYDSRVPSQMILLLRRGSSRGLYIRLIYSGQSKLIKSTEPFITRYYNTPLITYLPCTASALYIYMYTLLYTTTTVAVCGRGKSHSRPHHFPRVYIKPKWPSAISQIQSGPHIPGVTWLRLRISQIKKIKRERERGRRRSIIFARSSFIHFYSPHFFFLFFFAPGQYK